jgi:hypothetical protein
LSLGGYGCFPDIASGYMPFGSGWHRDIPLAVFTPSVEKHWLAGCGCSRLNFRRCANLPLYDMGNHL